jgi:hypothetical protein
VRARGPEVPGTYARRWLRPPDLEARIRLPSSEESVGAGVADSAGGPAVRLGLAVDVYARLVAKLASVGSIEGGVASA